MARLNTILLSKHNKRNANILELESFEFVRSNKN